MTKYGFVIDHRRCIGCHACTVACKSENDVPVGSFRTWVKSVEKGTYPDVRRHFTVLRCNHCDEAPCVEICPVNALEKRPDAIVDLDRDQCIGCKACMQACPYDALYLNEDRGVAEKCHFCAHRTEVGLQPACEVVCPTDAIVSGDTSDPDTPISTLIREQDTTRRRTEKGTQPRVWYVDALDDALEPGRAAEPDQYIWSDRRTPPPPEVPGFEPTPDLTVSLDADHPPVWGWHIWSYLVTKNLAAGAALIAPFLALMGAGAGRTADYGPELVGLVFLGLTNGLLVHDLGRPERFLKLLLEGNRRSWLVKGAWILNLFGALLVLSLLLRGIGLDLLADGVRWLNLPVAVMASGYTAWLFRQCRGRDLWIEPGLFPALVLRAALLGSAFALLVPGAHAAGWVLAAAAGLHALLLVAERFRTQATRPARKAHGILWRSDGPWAALLLTGPIAGGLGIAHATMAAESGVRELQALGLLALGVCTVGLLLYERAWIRAGQEVPNS